MATGLTALLWLKRAQKVEDFLLLASAHPIEMLDDHICLAALALVSSDGFYEIVGPPVMQEKSTLANSPEGGRSELVGTCAALRNAVGQACSHVVDK